MASERIPHPRREAMALTLARAIPLPEEGDAETRLEQHRLRRLDLQDEGKRA